MQAAIYVTLITNHSPLTFMPPIQVNEDLILVAVISNITSVLSWRWCLVLPALLAPYFQES